MGVAESTTPSANLFDETTLMDISVVIPTYNRDAVISRAIDSVLAQNLPAKQIIVVDDGSTDDTQNRVSNQYPQVELISTDNKGVSAARNLGIQAATGDWVAFLDSDDEWLADKLLKQSEAIEHSKGFLICHTDEIWIRNGVRVNPMKKHAKPGGWIFQQCLPLCCVSPSSVLIHKTIFDSVGMFDENLPACEDYDLWLRIFSRYPILLVPENLLKKYGGHDDQLSRRYWGMDRFRIQSLVKLLDSNTISAEQVEQVRKTLSKKITILMNGFEKRENLTEWQRYNELKIRMDLAFC